MAFKEISTGNWYVTSDCITVFPCAYRGKGTDGKTFDDTSRMFTEGNLTKLYGGGSLKNYDSFIIGNSTTTWDTTDDLEFVIHGYYFKVKLTTDDIKELAQKNLYATIVLNESNNYSRIMPQYGTSTDSTTTVDSEITVEKTTAVYFTAMKFVTEKPISGCYLQLTTSNLNGTTITLCKASLRPEVLHGPYEYQTIIGKYADTTSTSLFTVGNGTSTTAANIFNIAPAYSYTAADESIVNVVETITANAATIINNTLTVNNTFTLTGNFVLTDDLDMTGDLTVTGETQLKSNLEVNGNINTNGTLTADGAVTFGTAAGGTEKLGNTTFTDTTTEDSVKELTVKVGSTKKYVTVSDGANVVIDGMLSVNNTLSIADVSTFTKSVTINDETKASSDEAALYVAKGGAYIGGDLIVNGDIKSGDGSGTGTTLNGLTSTGTANFKANVTIGEDGKTADLAQYGKYTLNGTITVTDAEINNTLTCNGDVTLGSSDNTYINVDTKTPMITEKSNGNIAVTFGSDAGSTLTINSGTANIISIGGSTTTTIKISTPTSISGKLSIKNSSDNETAYIDADGSASLANKACTIDTSGNITTTGTISAPTITTTNNLTVTKTMSVGAGASITGKTTLMAPALSYALEIDNTSSTATDKSVLKIDSFGNITTDGSIATSAGITATTSIEAGATIAGKRLEIDNSSDLTTASISSSGSLTCKEIKLKDPDNSLSLSVDSGYVTCFYALNTNYYYKGSNVYWYFIPVSNNSGELRFWTNYDASDEQLKTGNAILYVPIGWILYQIVSNQNYYCTPVAPTFALTHSYLNYGSNYSAGLYADLTRVKALNYVHGSSARTDLTDNAMQVGIDTEETTGLCGSVLLTNISMDAE